MAAPVETRDLVKVWGATRALAGVSIRFEPATITAVLGPNGSGKSTLLALLAGLVRPSSGRVLWNGRDVRRLSADWRARVGIVGHAPMLYPELTARENLRVMATLHGLADATRRVERALDRFEAGSFADRALGRCSRGQVQRVALARALLHAPDLLLLDEPSTGLDVASTARLEQAVREERDRGAVVVLVTHDEGLATRLADRVVRLQRGRLVAEEPEAP
ncbi:MAG: heme ABC exporter ATP-binding protein CcmA [Myxococcota bacterium]|nr:heme ABC exporter ATP-binding protein CcmA [Myxococcota bacterium]MDW8360807.1 heme ABC exporter ATP-binding protein CcmA [Myxococcales bacterium]